MNVLVLGAGGLLGSNVTVEAQERGSVTGTYHSKRPALDVPLTQLDIREVDRFETILLEHDPDVVVNCAAMTDVDRCERDAETAREVNGTAPGDLARVCATQDIDFVHVSTDYVFDGTADTPYEETDEPAPRQLYGQSKLAGERTVQAAHESPLLVRLSFVWGIHRGTRELTGFPAWVRSRLAAGDPTPLFTDQHVTPSRAGAVAKTMLALAIDRVSGLFHVAARSCVTPYEFGQMLCDRLDGDASLIEPGSQADVDRPAPRPQYTCLDVSTIEAELERPQPTLAEDLAAVSLSV